MYEMNKKQLRLLPHNPLWKEDFQAEKGRILSAVDDPSIQIEHVGSTAIPNIYATQSFAESEQHFASTFVRRFQRGNISSELTRRLSPGSDVRHLR